MVFFFVNIGVGISMLSCPFLVIFQTLKTGNGLFNGGIGLTSRFVKGPTSFLLLFLFPAFAHDFIDKEKVHTL